MSTITTFSDRWLELGLVVAQTLILLFVWKKIGQPHALRKFFGWMLAGLLLCQVIYHTATYGLTWWYYAHDPVSKYLAPPYNQFLINRAVLSQTTIMINWAMTGALFGILWWIFLRRTKGVFIDHKEIILLVFSAAAVGWPGWLISFAGTFFLSILGMLGLVLLRKKKLNDRLVVLPYIIPAAILTLIFKVWLLEVTGLVKIRF